ncbi:hypothetical protein [Ruegeria sp. HKCCD7318]|uniref:hypothetical protein n=1 Tax=Ruegeria sp. HKCCD7318 TaxID=2683014 RepID=UPI001492E7CA|nr:hypothetical protein [Ruegeria sp. HKCCD7318]NOE36232.1 hypothetical protein [Ruegeria sp. HKCCD7318]
MKLQQLSKSFVSRCLVFALLLAPNIVASQEKDKAPIVERLACLEAILAEHRKLADKPYELFEVSLDTLPAFEDNDDEQVKEKILAAPGNTLEIAGAKLELSRELSGSQAIIGYNVSTLVQESQTSFSLDLDAIVSDQYASRVLVNLAGVDSKITYASRPVPVSGNGSLTLKRFGTSYIVTQLWMNDREIRSLRGIQSGRYQGFSPSGIYELEAPDGDGPIEIYLKYRTQYPVGERDILNSNWEDLTLSVAVLKKPLWPNKECGKDPLASN